MIKTRIESVSGNIATDVAGRQLKICSSVLVYPGCTVYTDGVYIYGWNWNWNQRKPVLKRRAAYIGDYPLYLSGAFWKAVDYIGAPYDTEVNIVSFPVNTVKYWPGRPSFFNLKNEFYSLRGSYEQPVLYKSSTGDVGQNITGSRLLLAYDDEKGFIWQQGNIAQRKATLENINYYHAVYMEDRTTNHRWIEIHSRRVSDTPSGYSDYGVGMQPPTVEPSYSLQNYDLNDMKLVIGKPGENESVINVSAIVSNILADVRKWLYQYIQTKKDETRSRWPWYPSTPPQPTQLGYGLMGGTPNFVVPYSGKTLILPCDSVTAKGGNPLYTVDFTQYTEYDSTEAAAAAAKAKNYKMVHNVQLRNGVLSFDLGIHSKMVSYGWPLSGGEFGMGSEWAIVTSWSEKPCNYIGWWHVDVALASGTVSYSELNHFYYYGTQQQMRALKAANSRTVAFDTGYTLGVSVSNQTPQYGDQNYTVDSVTLTYTDGNNNVHTLTPPSQADWDWTNVVDVKRINDGECLIFHNSKAFEHYVNNALSDRLIALGLVQNDSFVPNKNVNALSAFYTALANIPYYTL